MANLNRVFLMGNLTRDPEQRQTPNGHEVCQIGLAINRTYIDSAGQKQQDATFVNAEAWGKTVQLIGEYFHEGDPIPLEGRLKLDQWQGQDSQNRSRLKVVAENFQFIASHQQNKPTTKPLPQADPYPPSEPPTKPQVPDDGHIGAVNGRARRCP